MTIDELLDALESQTGRKPNQEQRVVMEYNDGPLHVIAGPGTGKTYALILRCLRLLCVDRVRPEAIVLTTFTHKAADELEQRLLTSLLQLSVVFPEISAIDLSRMHLGTLHSLCWDFITETPASPYRDLESLRQLDRAFFVYSQSRFCKNTSDSETEKLFLEIASWVENKTLDTLPPRWKRVEMFNTMYERIVHDRVDRVRFADSAPFRKELIHLIEEYETALDLRRFTDQTLMQQQALEVLCSQEGRLRTQNIEHVIVDEYQDTNPVQAAVYRALTARPPHHLCVVGDDDQALHRFRGGTVACMVRFEDECKKVWPGSSVRSVFLRETYRSHPAIVSWINEYITVHPQMSLEGARVHEKEPLHSQDNLYPDAPVVWAIRGKKIKDVASSFVEVLRALKE
jgi:DNA helicase II / ATP-dependent DNA helicase PcrA